jgi:hypothetical protein
MSNIPAILSNVTPLSTRNTDCQLQNFNGVISPSTSPRAGILNNIIIVNKPNDKKTYLALHAKGVSITNISNILNIFTPPLVLLLHHVSCCW